jgi:putative ABC transport system permease protein
MSFGAVVIGAFVLGCAGLAVLALRRPLLARLAFRDAFRQPGQSILTVLGLMVGTTAIFSMQLLSDSAVETEIQGVYRAFGHVDLIADNGGRFFDPGLASDLAADPRVRSATVGVQAGVELDGSAVDLDRDNARPVVQLIGFDPATQVPFGAYVLRDGRRTLGQDLAPGEVLVSASLADALEARVGDRLRLAIGPDRTADLRVAGVAEATGPGAYGLRPAVFAPLASLRQVTGRPDVNVIRIATAGEGRAELDRGHQAAGPVRTALAALAGGHDLRVREAKRDEAESARELAQANASIFTGLAFLVALSGVTLVVILALALAEERRPRHAVLRALGLTRSGLVGLSVLEGGIYGVVAALLAPISGALLGLGLVRFFAQIWRLDPAGARAPQLQPAFEPGSLGVAVAIGGLITLATLCAASVRSSRMVDLVGGQGAA